jgi:alpha-tubulin suppressor-like RCC1 family protein
MNLWKRCRRPKRRPPGFRPQNTDFRVEPLEPRQLLSVSAPEVSVGLVASGSEANGSSSVFRFERTGSTAQGLTVNAFLGGTAAAGNDYSAPAGLATNGVFTISFPAGSASASLSLPTLADAVHDPSESIIAIVQPGTNYSIKPAGDRATAIISAEGVSGVAVDPNRASQSESQHRNGYAFAALLDDGSVVPWGGFNQGGDADPDFFDFDGPNDNLFVRRLFSTESAFAAIRNDGTAITWGSELSGGLDIVGEPGDFRDISTVDFRGLSISTVSSTQNAFAAILSNGLVVTWGHADDILNAPINLYATSIATTTSAFAALRTNGQVVTWGEASSGGVSTGIDWNGPANNLSVQRIFATDYAFAALRNDGSVVTWGDTNPYATNEGGNSDGVEFNGPDNDLRVVDVTATSGAFAALRSDGSVVAWGNQLLGGDASQVDFDGPNGDLHVVRIFSNNVAFAALRSDGSVVTWGDEAKGGDSTGTPLTAASNGFVRVVDISSTGEAFAAIRLDGSVVTWGLSTSGGDASTVDFDGPANNLTVRSISSTSSAFAALRSDGSVVAWGAAEHGGDLSAAGLSAAGQLPVVTQIVGNDLAFAALRSDGSVVTWGREIWGGNSSDVDFNGMFGTTKVVAIASPLLDVRLDTVAVSSLINVEAYGNVALNRDANGRLYANASPITHNGNPITSQFSAQWTIIEVEHVAGQNTVFARHDATGQIHRWRADASWAIDRFSLGIVSSRTLDPAARGSAAPPLPWIESPTSSTPLEAGGSVVLRRSIDGRLLAGDLELIREELPIDASSSDGYAAIAADVVENARRLLIRGPENVLQEWTFDVSWYFISEGSPYAASGEPGRLAEVRFQIDIDGNGVIGSLG